MDVHVIGVGKDQYNEYLDQMVEGRILPWTEDSQSEGYPVWTDWEAGQRDVFFLDRNGVVDTTFNITPYDPGNPDDYTYIMNLILDLRDEQMSSVLNVPGDYPTIQEGIDAASDGDIVLVADGTYYENLIVNKEITIASHYINDGDLSHRDNTIIDGSQYDEEEGPFGSCVLFRPSENGDAITTKLTGFTIQNGLGTRVRETIETPVGEEVMTYYMGGGLMIWYTLPEITYNYIRENGSELDTRAGSTRRGGAAGLNTDDDVEFDEDRSEPYDRTILTRDDVIVFSNNIFENNDSETGNTFESIGYVGDIDFSDSFFDVYSSEYEGISGYWFVTEDAITDFSGGSGVSDAITADVYVSPGGSDENDGLTTISSFQHIAYALSRVYADSLNPATIILGEGIYSPSSNGELFPIDMVEYVIIAGEGESQTIIDAEQMNRVINIEKCATNIFSNLTITGGYAPDGDWPQSIGGGIYCISSDPIFTNVTIKENTSTGNFGRGGGIYFDNSNPTLTDVTITNNTTHGIYYYPGGGGIYCWNSSAYLEDVTVTGNSANWGGGIQCYKNSDAELINVVINNNTAWDGGGLFIRESNLNLINLLIDGNTAESSGGGIYCWNSNSVLENVIITNNTAQFNGGGIVVEYGNPNLSNNIISDNYSGGSGGGLYCWHGEPNLIEVELNNNTAYHYGGGLYFRDATPILQNITISNNIASQSSGGGIYFWNSSTNLTNTTITGNSAPIGGGIRCENCNVGLVNTILWNDSPEEINIYSGSVDAMYSDIQGGWTGEGNIDANPLFIDPNNSDFTLQEGSPCIDAGTADLDGDGIEDITNFVGSAPDMGAFEFGEVAPSIMSVEYLDGWNMVGLPLQVEDANYQTLFPEAASGSLYSYGGSYNAETNLVPGTGYWLRLVTGGVVEFTGSSIDELSVSVIEGWNLISGLSTPVDVAVLYSSGLVVTGGIYEYDGSYVSPEVIHPGMGYWLRATQDGEITLSSTALATKILEQANHLEGSNTLELSNGTHSTTLYFGKDVSEREELSYSLPPVFPQMAFDARFTDNMKYIQDAGEISVINTNSRLTLNYSVNLDPGEHLKWVFTTNSGKEHILNGTGEITLPPETKGMSLEKRAIFPDVYALYQNYPNPFNPVTKITYQLPEESYVAITIYNLAGQKVTTLVDGRRSGGFHAVDWYGKNSNGESVASGLYFFRIEAENFSKTLKMLLLK